MQPTNRIKRDLSLKEVLVVLRRQWLTFAVVFMLCLAAGAISFRMTRAVFKSNLKILVEMTTAGPTSANTDPMSQVSSPTSYDSLATQIQWLDGSPMMRAIYEGHALGIYNEFDPFSPTIEAKQVEDTNVLALTVQGSDPSIIGPVAYYLPDTYKEWLIVRRDYVLNKGLEYLAADRLSQEISYNSAVAAAQKAKSSRSLPALTGEASVRSGRVTQTANESDAAEAQVAVAEKNLNTLQAQLKGLSGPEKTTSVHPNNSEIESVKSEIAQLEQQKAELLQTWKEGSPKIKDVNARIESAHQHLLAIPPVMDDSPTTENPLKVGLRTQVQGARVALNQALVQKEKANVRAAKALKELEDYTKVDPTETRLEGEIVIARNRMVETQQAIDALKLKRAQVNNDPIKVISQASPIEKVRPILGQYVLVSVLAGLVLSVLVSLVKDHVEDKVTSAEDVFQLCGLEPLAQMPRMQALTAPTSASTAIERHEPPAELFDSYRLLRFNLLNAAERGYMGSLVITSATGAEGKSDLAADLASVMAAGGRRVILVDANLRNPSVAARFSLRERPGMTDVLIGEATLEEALVPTNIDGLSVLPAGAKTPNPVDLLESSQMVSLHSSLRELADLVIFDAPSCLTFADVSVLASFTDSVIVVAELGTTKRDMLNRGVNLIQRSSARLVGVVLRERQAQRKRGRRKAAA
ncbi:MAG TPA: polysaccharide biosynthesis tyrosine autokinase [Fimbriimonadaceae bacterium]|nr:polysaccharide biosynthesis tyrosine autokinase [Fimbriimonadaceae bacterium]